MWFASSMSITWRLCSTLLFLCLVVAQQDNVKACDEDFKEALLQEFKILLDSKLNQINARFDRTDNYLGKIQEELALVSGSVSSIDTDMNKVKRKSSQNFLTSNEVKSVTSKIYNEVQSISEKLNISDNTVLLRDSIEDLNNSTLYLTNNIIDMIKSSSETKELLQNSTQKIKTKSNTKIAKCTEKGGFLVSNQCFVFFGDQELTWSAAKSKCKTEGLRLAEPSHEVAVPLRSYLVFNYGGHGVWLGAKYDQSYMRWQSTNGRTVLYKTNPLWWGNSMNDNTCLWLMATDNYLRQLPTQPYLAISCSRRHSTLCEYVIW